MSFSKFEILCSIFLTLLSCNVRKESHEPRALDGKSQLALVFGRDAASLSGLNAAVRVEELLKKLNVLIINVLDIVL